MRIYVAEFRPKNINKTPFFWKLVLNIIGTGYYHTGVLIGNRYFEMHPRGYREIKFESYQQLNDTRGQQDKNKVNDGDSIDFIEIPYDVSPLQAQNCIEWWEEKIKPGMFFGFTRFAQLIFANGFRKLSEWYFNKTGRVLLFAKSEAERSVRVCSSAVDESLKYIGLDVFKHMDETITTPGLFAKYFPIVYHGN